MPNERLMYREIIFRIRVHKHFLCSYMLASFLLLFSNSMVTSNSCNSIPVSLSNFSHCEGSTCYFSTTAALSIPLLDKEHTCIEFISPDGVSPSTYLNLTVMAAHFRWNIDGFDYSDDPAASVHGSCSCNPLHILTKVNCPGDVSYHDVVLATSITHRDKSCPLTHFGIPGTACHKTGLSFNKRYKSLNVDGIVNPFVNLEIASEEFTSNIYYSGSPVFHAEDDIPFNITFLSDTSKVLFKPEVIVYDLHAPTDVYLLNRAEVNTKTEYNLGKFGWNHVTDSGTNVGTLSTYTMHVTKCTKNQIDYQYNWINHAQYLQERVHKLGSKVTPRAILVDPEFRPDPSSKYNSPNHAVSPYTYLVDGIMFNDFSGNLNFFGYTEEFIPTPYPINSEPAGEIPIGVLNDGTTLYNISTYQGVMVNIRLADQHEAVKLMIWGPEAPFFWNNTGVCLVTADGMQCNGFSVVLALWPHGSLYNVVYNKKFTKTVVAEEHNETDLYFLTEMGNGVLNVLVEFKDLRIQFVDQNVKPRINSIKYNDSHIIVNAQSITVGGTCFTYSYPAALMIAQAVDLSVTNHEFLYDMSIANYSDNAVFGIRCHKYSDEKTVFVQVNQVINETDFVNGTSVDEDEDWHVSLDPRNWGKVLGHGLGGIFGDIFGAFTGNLRWWHYVLYAVIIIICIVVVALLIWFLWPFFSMLNPMNLIRRLRKKKTVKKESVPISLAMQKLMKSN